MGSAETSANTRRPDPAADLREATERNAREKREEEEAERLEKAEADRAAASAQKKLEDAEAALAARRRAEEAARRRSAMLVPPLSSAPPPPEFTGQTGGAGTENPVAEKESGEASMSDTLVPPPPPPPPSGRPHGKQPVGPSEPPVTDEAEARLLLQVASPVRRRLERATSAPRPRETGAASSATLDAEATSAAPTGWLRGGGTGPLNQALLDVQAKLRAEGDALQTCTRAHLAARTAVRVRFLLLFDYCFSLSGRATAPSGCSPRVPGRLLSRRFGTPSGEFQTLTLSSMTYCRSITTSAPLPSTAMLRS